MAPNNVHLHNLETQFKSMKLLLNYCCRQVAAIDLHGIQQICLKSALLHNPISGSLLLLSMPCFCRRIKASSQQDNGCTYVLKCRKRNEAGKCTFFDCCSAGIRHNSWSEAYSILSIKRIDSKYKLWYRTKVLQKAQSLLRLLGACQG